MRILLCSILALFGLSIGYWQGTPSDAVVSPAPAEPPGAASGDPGAQTLDPTSSAASRHPVSRENAAGAAAPLPMLALPALTPSWSSSQDELRRRAEEGDATAARDWMLNDARCFSMQYFGAGSSSPTEAFQRAYGDARSNFPNLTNADSTQLADARKNPDALRTSLGDLQQRLLAECHGYQPANPRIRYALGEIAARNGEPKDFWNFIRRPPFSPQSPRDIDQARDWATRAPQMLQQHAAAGDADAAYALGLAYAQDGQAGWRGLRGSGMLDAAISNDPAQAFRWLSLYTMAGADTENLERARTLLAQVAAQLDPAQRADAERWAREYAASHYPHH
ncbi:MAG: hypothetical protein ABI411_16420 [Tahibacter sp.]